MALARRMCQPLVVTQHAKTLNLKLIKGQMQNFDFIYRASKALLSSAYCTLLTKPSKKCLRNAKGELKACIF